MNNTCPSCGANNKDGTEFCEICGSIMKPVIHAPFIPIAVAKKSFVNKRNILISIIAVAIVAVIGWRIIAAYNQTPPISTYNDGTDTYNEIDESSQILKNYSATDAVPDGSSEISEPTELDLTEEDTAINMEIAQHAEEDTTDDIEIIEPTEEERYIVERKSNDDYRYEVYSDNTVEILEYFHINGVVILTEEIDEYGVDIGVYDFYFEPVTIPDNIDGYKVTSIGNYAFKEFRGLVTIPNSVTSIGNGAFQNCIALTAIPNSLVSIGNNAFQYCPGLTSITIPNSVTSIGNGAFGGCVNLISITIPDSVTSIGDNAFYLCPPNLIISCSKDSAAYEYCIKNNIDFSIK